MAFLHEKQTVNTGTKNYWVKLDDMLNILESITVNVIMVLYGGFDQLLVPHTHCILPMYRVIFLQRIKYKRYMKCLAVMFRSRCDMRSFMPMKFAISPHYTLEFKYLHCEKSWDQEGHSIRKYPFLYKTWYELPSSLAKWKGGTNRHRSGFRKTIFFNFLLLCFFK